MFFELLERDGFRYLGGTYVPADPADPPPALLGPVETSSSSPDAGIWVGVDAPYDSPVYLRAYADPSLVAELHERDVEALAGRYVQMGFVQFVQARVLGHAVPPEVLWGEGARGGAYSAGPGGDHCFVDFMAPGNAADLMQHRGLPPPFYAYNALLFSPESTVEAFGSFRAPTGSLWIPTPAAPVRDPVTGPSLLAQINVPLVTEASIEAMVGGRAPLLRVPVTAEQTATIPLYRLVVERLRDSGDPRVTGYLGRTLTLEDVTRVRLAGHYMLLNVAAPENREPVLAATLLGDGPDEEWLVVHLLEHDEIRVAGELTTVDLVNGAVEHLAATGVHLPAPPPRRGRGAGGLDQPRVPVEHGDVVLRVRVAGVAFGLLRHSLRSRTMEPLSGFALDLKWSYDAVSRTLVWAGVDEVRAVRGDEAEFTAALDAYVSAVEHAQATPQPVDTTDFPLAGTPWAAPSPTEPRPLRMGDRDGETDMDMDG